MNRFLVYTVIAILLGSVTMVAPLALLGADNLVPAATNDNVLGAGEGPAERNDSLVGPDIAPQQTEDTGTYDTSSEKPSFESGLGQADAASGLSSMGLMIIPGFLVALGIFVYLKKRVA
ncbi:MAG: hypothetical protein ACWGNP_03200 [Candidatus Bathyarchaeia archaeon]